MTVSLVNGNGVIVTATAAKGTNGKVTKAYVGRDSEVYANGVTENENTVHSLKVSAESNLTITAKVPETKSIGAVKLGVFLVKTIAGKTDTWAAILGKAESTNDIFVLATDKIRHWKPQMWNCSVRDWLQVEHPEQKILWKARIHLYRSVTVQR